MAVDGIRIKAVEPYSDRRYEWVEGTVDFAVDPQHRANQRIVDLDLAPRDGAGLVRFEADLRVLRPVNGGSRNLLFVVANRGLLGALPFSLGAGDDFANRETPEPGDGFLLDRGWTIAWCGWQWDVLRGRGRLGLNVPEAELAPGPAPGRSSSSPTTPPQT